MSSYCEEDLDILCEWWTKLNIHAHKPISANRVVIPFSSGTENIGSTNKVGEED